MEKYTDLKQAREDQSLVFITDEVNTLRELNRIYGKFRILPRKQQRLSDYYSNQFLDHSVKEMYELVKERLLSESELFNDLKEKELPGSKYAKTEADLYYKEANFNAGETNVCFILGHSGSGKSVMAKGLEGNEIEHLELDDLLLVKDHFSMDDLKNYSDVFYSFFIGPGKKYYIGIEERNTIPKEEYEDKLFFDFVDYALAYAGKHQEKKYIIDGIWIYLYYDDPSVFDDYAVFIKGTSFLKSKIRATKREIHRDKEEIADRKLMFGREARNYLLDEDKIDRFRDHFAKSPYTIFREEENEIDKQNEIVRNEIININRCFAQNDANGIIAIMKKTEADTQLSNLNKIRIIGECKAALFEI